MCNLEPPCSSLSYAVIRMARIALYEPLVSLGSSFSYRAEQGCPLARVKDLSPFERGRPLPPSEGNVSLVHFSSSSLRQSLKRHFCMEPAASVSTQSYSRIRCAVIFFTRIIGRSVFSPVFILSAPIIRYGGAYEKTQSPL